MEKIIQDYSEVVKFVKTELSLENGGHGFQHALRVFHNAKKICEKEGGNEKIILTASLIHDTIDKKIFKNIVERITLVKKFLHDVNYSEDEIEHIIYIISNISWNKGENKELNSSEAKIVRDADRLDAIGAIGIIRAIEYGNSQNHSFYTQVNLKKQNEKYSFNKLSETTISHFYEKLLLLKDFLHTKTAKEIAQKRHDFMIDFLNEFYSEL